MPVTRVSSLIHDRGNAGLRALFDGPALPSSTYPAFKEAIEAMREGGFAGEPGGAARLKRRMIERVLTRCENKISASSSRCSRCCAASPPKPRARKRVCSATGWWRRASKPRIVRSRPR